jgi:hypothetical protein
MIKILKLKVSDKRIVAKRGKDRVLVYKFMPKNNLLAKAKWLEKLLFS